MAIKFTKNPAEWSNRQQRYNLLNANGEVVATTNSLPDGVDENNPVVYRSPNGDLSAEPQASISINKETGNIKIRAPKSIYESDAFKQVFKTSDLEALSRAYKMNPAVKIETSEGEMMGIEELVGMLNEDIKKYVKNVANEIAVKNALAETFGENFRDMTQEQIVRMGSSGDLEKRSEADALISVPKTVSQIFPTISALGTFGDDAVKQGDFLENFYNLEKTSGDDIVKLRKIIDAYFENGDYSDLDEFAKMYALRDFIYTYEPETNFWQKEGLKWGAAGEGVARATAGFTAGLISIVQGASDLLVNAMEGSTWLLAKAFGEDYTMKKPSEVDWDLINTGIEAVFGTEDLNAELANQYADRTEYYYTLNRNAATTMMISYLASSVAENVIAGKAIGNLIGNFTAAVALSRTNLAAEAAGAGKIVSNAGESFTAWNKIMLELTGNANPSLWQTIKVLSTADTTKIFSGMRMTLGTLASLPGAAASAKLTNEISQAAKILKTSQLAATGANFLAQVTIDTTLASPTAIRRIISGDATEEDKQVYLREIAWNAAGYGIGIFLSKAVSSFAKTKVGEAANAWATQKMASAKTTFHDIMDKIKTKFWGPDWMDNISDVGKKQVARYNEIINEATRQVANATADIGSTSYAVSQTQAVKDARALAVRVQNEVDNQEAGLKYYMNLYMGGTVEDATKTYYPALSDALREATNKETELAKLLDELGIETNVKPTALVNGVSTNLGLPQDVVNYVDDRYSRDYLIRKRLRDGFLTSDEEKGLEIATNRLLKFDNTRPPELVMFLNQQYYPALKRAYQQINTHRNEAHIESRANRKGLIESGLFGKRGQEWIHMQAITDFQKDAVDNTNRLSKQLSGFDKVDNIPDYYHYTWGVEKDYVHPQLALQNYLWQTAVAENARNAWQNFSPIYKEKTELLVSGEAGEAAQTYQNLKKKLDKVSKLGLGSITEDLNVDGAVFNVVQDLANVKALEKAQKKALKAQEEAVDIATKDLKVTQSDKLAAVMSMSDDSIAEVLGDESMSNIGLSEESWDKLVKDASKKIKKSIEELFYEHRQLTGYDPTYTYGISEKYINADGYRLYGEDNLEPLDNVGNAPEAIVLNTIRPGGDIDWFNGEIRAGKWNTVSDELADVLIQNFGDYNTDHRVLDAFGVTDDGFGEPDTDALLNGWSKEDLRSAVKKMVQNGNYKLKNPGVFYRGLSRSGNRVNNASDFSWLEKDEFSDDGYAFVTLDPLSAERKFTAGGDGYLLRYHLPKGQGLFYFESIGRGANDGGAMVLPPAKEAKIVRTGEKTADGVEVIDIVYNGASVEDGMDYTSGLGFKDYRMAFRFHPEINSEIDRLRVQNDKRYWDNSIVEKVAVNQKRAKLMFEAGDAMNETARQLNLPTTNDRMEAILSAKRAVEGFKKYVLKDVAAREVIDSIAFSVAPDNLETARDYITLKILDKNKKELRDSLVKLLDKEKFSGLLKKKWPGAIKKHENALIKLITDEIKEELNDSRELLRAAGETIIDEDDVMAEIKSLVKDIDDLSDDEAVVSIYNDQGQLELYRTDPVLADLYNYRPIIQPSKTELVFGNAVFRTVNRVARFFQLTLNPKAYKTQLWRDLGNRYFGVGAYLGMGMMSKDLQTEYGGALARKMIEDMKVTSPSTYEFLLKEAEATGQTLEELTVARYMSFGRITSPAETPTAFYREPFDRGEGFAASLKRTKNKFTELGNKWMEKAESLHQRREIYLRDSTYAAGMHDGLDNGMTVKDAQQMAQFFQRNGTTNFGRQLYHFRALQKTVNYFGAGVNGFTSFWRLFSLDPVGVATRIFSGIVVPTIFATAMTLANEENREKYIHLPEYYKKDQFIFMMNGQIYRIPIPQELDAFVAPIRQAVESLYKSNRNSFGELLLSDFLNIGPVDFSGIMMLDRDRLLYDSPSILDRAGALGLDLIDQTMPNAIKLGVQTITGIDTYTGDRIDNSYYIIDDDNNRVLVGGTTSKFALQVAKTTGASPSIIAHITESLVGQVGEDILDVVFGGESASSLLENTVSGLTEFQTANYNLIRSEWNNTVAELWAEKEKIYLPAYVDYSDKINQESDPKKIEALKTERQNAIQPFLDKVKMAVGNLKDSYGGSYDRFRFASVVSLLTFDTGTTTGNTAEARLADKSTFYDNRNNAYLWMTANGLNISDSDSLLGYLTRNADGETVIKYNTPTGILAMRDTLYGAADRDTAEMQIILDGAGIKRGDMFGDDYSAAKAQGKAALKQYKAAWNAKVVRLLAPYIQERGVGSVLNNETTRDLLGNYLFIDSPYQTKQYLTKIFGGD